MQRLRGNYKLAKKEILTVWGAEFPSRPSFSYVATQELLRRDAGIATSRRRKMGIERGKGQAMESPGTGVRRGHRERAWVKIQKGAKGQKVKSHIWQKRKGESEKVKVKLKRWMWNWKGECGEWWIGWICRIYECDFSKNRNETNPKYHIIIINMPRLRLLNTINY